LVRLYHWGSLLLPGEIDECDLWPRYYFDFDAAQSEAIAWLKTRKLYDEQLSVWKNNAGLPDGSCCVNRNSKRGTQRGRGVHPQDL